MYSWSRRQTSLKKVFRPDSTILAMTPSGLPCALNFSASTSRSRDTTEGSRPDGSSACGLAAATCMANLRPSCASSSRSRVRRFDGLQIGPGLECRLGNHFDQSLKMVIAGNEIGLRIDFNHDPVGRRQRDRDQAVGGDPT